MIVENASSPRPFLRIVSRTAGYNVATTGLGALTGVLLARWLGADGRGDYAATVAYLGFALLIFELGMGSSVVYHVSRLRQAHREYVRTAAAVLVPLAALASAVAVVAGLFLFGDSPVRRAAFLVLPIAVVSAFLGAPASFALQSLNIVRWNLVRLVQPMAFLVLLVGAHHVTALRAPLVVLLLGITFLIQAGLAWVFYRREAPRTGRAQRRHVRPMLRFGLLNMSSTAPNAVNARADQLVLALLVPSAALGQYAVAVSLSVLAAPLVQAFGNVAFPGVARGEDVARTIKLSIVGSLAVSVLSLAAVLAVGPFLIPRVYGPEYRQVPSLLLILAPGAAVVVVNQVLGDLLRGLGRPSKVALAEGVGVIFTVGGLLLMVPHFGVTGAAITSTVTYLIVFVVLMVLITQSRPHQATTARSQPTTSQGDTTAQHRRASP